MLILTRSFSYRAAAILRPGVTGRMLASFERVCDLVTDGGEVVALVWGGIGDGPLNVVLAQRPGVVLPVDTRFTVSGESDGAAFLVLESPATGSPIVIDLASAVPWNPQPDWDSLRMRRPQIAAGAEMIVSILAEAGWSPARCGLPEALCERAAGGDPKAIHALVGLGPGLTPAGDDWLAGWLLAQHVGGDLRGLRNLEGLIVAMTAERTTTLSRAFLACAAAGEADENWHALLSTLAADPMTNLPIHQSTNLPIYQFTNLPVYQSTNLPIYQSTQTILSHGATSGAAMLLGFCAGMGIR